MNDREWDDYMMGNKMSPYPRVQDILQRQEALSKPPPIRSRPRSSEGPREPGLVALYLEWLGQKAEWIANNVPPFRQLIALSAWLGKRGWKVKALLGCVGALLAASFIYGTHEPGSIAAGCATWLRGLLGVHVSWVSALTGFVAGFSALWFTGGLIEFTIRLCLGVFLFALTLLVIWGVYALAAVFFGWPIPFI